MWTLVAKLGHYWDTMGWIKFQQGKMEQAEKYLFANWPIANDLMVSFHLGRIYEAQDRKNEAIEIYLAALTKISPSTTLSDDAKETRTRLANVLGGDSQVEERLEQSRKKRPPFRMVSVANPGGEQGIAQYTVLIDANSKVIELQATNSDDPFASLNDAIHAATMPQAFPDTTLKRLPHPSTLSCTGSDPACIFTLLPSNAAARLTPLD